MNLHGLIPASIPRLPIPLDKERLAQKQKQYEIVIETLHVFFHKIVEFFNGKTIAVILTDDERYILDIQADDTVSTSYQHAGMQNGIQFNEKEMGTNVIHLALETQREIQLIGDDHYLEFMHKIACYCVPFHFKVLDVSGTIGIMTLKENHSPYILPFIKNTVDSMEREIELFQKNQELQKVLIHESLYKDLTQTERLVFDLRRGGYKNTEIAEQLFMSFHTVRNHIKRIRKKLASHGLSL